MLKRHIKTIYYYLRIYFLIKRYKNITIQVDRDEDVCKILITDLFNNNIYIDHNSNRLKYKLTIIEAFKKIFIDCYMFNIHILDERDLNFIIWIKEQQDIRQLLTIEITNDLEPFDNIKL